MSNPKRLKLVLAIIFTFVLTACGEEDEPTVPIPQDVTAAYLDSCISGKGWIHVSSHEVKANGTLEKTEYWSAPDAGKPHQYFFGGDTITTYLDTEASSMSVYQVSRYTYNRLTHQLKNQQGEVFKLISASPTELSMVQYKGFSGNGERIFIYSIYRPMNAGELALCRRTHPYNLATINHEFPVLPEQTSVTPADFRLKAVNHGWKCTSAFIMETDDRYSATDIQKLRSPLVPDNLYFTADSLTAFKHGVFKGFTVSGKSKYSFRANSFSLDTGTGAGLRILSLSADEMKVVVPAVTNGGQNNRAMYCIYKRMTADELARNGNGNVPARRM